MATASAGVVMGTSARDTTVSHSHSTRVTCGSAPVEALISVAMYDSSLPELCADMIVVSRTCRTSAGAEIAQAVASRATTEPARLPVDVTEVIETRAWSTAALQAAATPTL